VNTKSQRRTFVVLFVLLALSVLAPVAMWRRTRDLAAQAEAENARTSANSLTGRAVDRRLGVVSALPAARAGANRAAGSARALSSLGLEIRERLRGIDPATARPGELVVVFDSTADYQGFLGGTSASGLPISGRIPELAAVWLVPGPTPTDDVLESLAQALEPYARIAELGPNLKMFLSVPSRYEETPTPLAVPALSLLGLPAQALGADNAAGRRSAGWGRDFMIALLDTGVAPAAVNARTLRGRDSALLGTLDAGWGTEPADLRGSGTAATLSWIAPGARIVGVRVTDDEGVSDVFSVAQGIVSAMNVGANLIEISPAGPEQTLILNRAVGLVFDRGVTVVASTGGDAGTWPAADPRVIPVGSILTRRKGLADDPVATPQILLDQAPLDSAASAAIVAGALVDVMSVYPGTKAAEAWRSLQYMTNEASAERSRLATEFYATGLQVLNLSWVGMPLSLPPGQGSPVGPGNAYYATAAGLQSGRAGGAGQGRVLIGPQPGGRRGAGNRGVGSETGAGRKGGRSAALDSPVTPSDRTVRGNAVPIGTPGRVGGR